jgi:lipopolysaccharide transport system ATP-binding protein
LSTVSRWCDTVLWLEEGRVQGQGMPQRVIDLYRQHIAAHEAEEAVGEHLRRAEEVSRAQAGETSNRWGSREVEIVSVKMFHPSGQERYVYQSGEPVRVVIHYRVHHTVPDTVFGIALMRSDGLWCYGTNTAVEDIPLPPLGEEGRVEVLLERVDFVAGTYYLDVAVHAMDGYPYDYHHGLYFFTVKSDLQEVGVCRIPHSWAIQPSVAVP